ncbi:MAG: DUF1127 domain-containing protein [Rhodoferax sp.]|nr:DUF1127 domain-containing protein [Pseudorhodobacter sp.]
MAYVNSSRSLNISVADRLGNIAKSVKLALRRRALFNQTVRELNALSDRDLADLGIHGSMIKDIAKQAAYGK